MTGRARTRIVDAHTHVFPTEWVADRSYHLSVDRWFGSLYEPESARMIDAAGLVDAMDAAGVDHAVMCGWPWTDPGLCREHNDYLASAAARSGGRLSWLGIVSPAAEGSKEAERCIALGARGIGELNADAQGFDLVRSGVVQDVASILTEAGLPILLHASEPVGHVYPGKGAATPERLVKFLETHQGLKVVLAHWGGGLPFYELMPEVAELTRNVSYDTAASSYLYDQRVFRAVIDMVGAERVVWGSDHPVLGMGRFLRRTLRDPTLSEDELNAILGDNARRIYRLADTEREIGPNVTA